MTGSYNLWLVALSYVIATIASYVALNLSSRVGVARGRLKALWLVGGSAAMGLGIWSMHFIGMLAFHLPIDMTYDVPTTLWSMLVAMLASALALFTVNRDALTLKRLIVSGVAMGSGIAAMHYEGMAAMQVFPAIRYEAVTVAASVLAAVAASIVALVIAFRLRSDNIKHVVRKRVSGALVLAAAIVAMHYTGMAAAHFADGSICIGSGQKVSSVWLAATVAGCTILLLTATMLLRGDEVWRPSTVHRSFGIRMKLALSYLLLSLLVASFGLAALWVERDSAERMAVSEAAQVASVMADALGDDASMHREALERAVNNMRKHHARDAFVVDLNRRVIADADAQEIGTVFARDGGNEIANTMADDQVRTFVERDPASGKDAMQLVIALHKVAPDPKSPVTGALVLEYTGIYDALLSQARAVSYLIVAMGVAFVFLAAAIGLRLASMIASPIAELEQSAAALAGGAYEARVPVRSNDEIGALAAAFNRMAADLSVSHQKLVQHQAELETRVAERTLECQRAENAQRETAAELRLIAEHMPVALCYVDKDQRYRYHNRRFSKLFGPGYEDVVGRTVTEVIGETDYEATSHWIDRALSGEQVTYERTHTYADGTTQELFTTLVPRRDEHDDVIGYYAMKQDVSSLKRAAEALRRTNTDLTHAITQLRETRGQLLQAEKMSSIGQLASGVAHEINNPIGYVQSNLGTLDLYLIDIFALLDRYKQAEASITDPNVLAGIATTKQAIDFAFVNDDARKLLGQSKEGISRVAKIVRDLKNFSRSSGDEAWQWADLHDGIDTTLEIVWNEIKYRAEVKKEYGDLPQVKCHASQLNQVFMNMLVNGAHAIDQRGTITIRTGVDGDNVWIDFADTGQGIKPEHISRIFEPFFTTKPVGKGTGLGLSLAYGIIEAHHGKIEVQTALGEGTTFRIWLPTEPPGSETAAAGADAVAGPTDEANAPGADRALAQST